MSEKNVKLYEDNYPKMLKLLQKYHLPENQESMTYIYKIEMKK